VKCPILGFLQFFCPKNYKKIKYKKSNTKITKKSNADITSKYFYIFSCMNFCTNVFLTSLNRLGQRGETGIFAIKSGADDFLGLSSGHEKSAYSLGSGGAVTQLLASLQPRPSSQKHLDSFAFKVT
jgi:hypothetical protein